MSNPITDKNLYLKITELLQSARQTVVRAVNQTMVYTYFEIGRMIVEDEQQGKERAEYGKQVLKELSKNLTENFGKGFSVENLDRMRFFYKTYMPPISSTALTKLENSKNQEANLTSIPKMSFGEFQKMKIIKLQFSQRRCGNSVCPGRIISSSCALKTKMNVIFMK